MRQLREIHVRAIDLEELGVVICNHGYVEDEELRKQYKHNARLIAAAPDLLEALQAYRNANSMTQYGDASDFVFPNKSMRKEGDPAWGWICEKHGLSYQAGCICCADEFKRHKVEKDRQARSARNDALTAADEQAHAAIRKALGEEE